MYLNGTPFIKVNYQKSSCKYRHLIGLYTSSEIANKTLKYKYDILPFCKPTEFFVNDNNENIYQIDLK